MAFLIKKTVPLDSLGEEWKDCSLTLRGLSWAESSELAKRFKKVGDDPDKLQAEMISFLQSRFIEGRGIDDTGKRVAIAKEDLADLPFEVVSDAIHTLTGNSGKKEDASTSAPAVTSEDGQ